MGLKCFLQWMQKHFTRRIWTSMLEAKLKVSLDDSVTAVILKKRNHISGTARNVTMDRLFTSVESVSRLLHDHRLTVIGTIRFSQKSLPKEVKNVKDEPVKSLHSVQSLFCIPCRYDTYFICPKKVKESITCTVNVHTTITK